MDLGNPWANFKWLSIAVLWPKSILFGWATLKINRSKIDFFFVLILQVKIKGESGAEMEKVDPCLLPQEWCWLTVVFRKEEPDCPRSRILFNFSDFSKLTEIKLSVPFKVSHKNLHKNKKIKLNLFFRGIIDIKRDDLIVYLF
jgi:hypothetical protein